MSISIYTIPDHPLNESRRAEALRRLDLLYVIGDAALDAIASELCAVLETSMTAVTLIHGYDAYLIAAVGFPTGIYRRSTSLCGHAILAPQRPFVVLDTATDERFAGNPFVAGDKGIRFYAAAQLIVAGDLAIGTLCAFDTAPKAALTPAQEQALLRLGDRAMERLHALADDS